MNFVPYAVPFFLLLILAELAWGWLKGNNTYRINDSLNSLSLGLLSTVTKFVFLNIGLMVFSNIGQNYAIWSLDVTSTGHWLLGILLYDFLYYWYHRISHERQLFWGSHVVHHQSEDYNLSTALRQTSTSFLTTWVFFIPCFFLGMPIYMYASIATAHLVYQFWVHTQHIGKLGFLEWFIVSPSNHRVHHAQNPDYIDKNYGGLLIVWDRLFGTFQEEDEQQKPIYGIRVALSSWNPLWANVHIFINMARDAWRANAWTDKVRVLWSKTGWRPDDVAKRYPASKSDLNHFKRYDPKLSARAKVAMVGQYLLLTFFHLWSASQVTTLSYELLWVVVIAQILTLVVIGAVLDGKPFAKGLELSRWVVMTALLYSTFAANLMGMDWLYYAIAYLVMSASLMWICIGTESTSEIAASSDPA